MNSSWIVSSLHDDENDDGNEDTTAESRLTTAAATSPSSFSSSSIPTHLFLHFDINETILLGDDAGGDSRNESAQKMIAKSAFCRIPTPTTSTSTSQLAWENTQQFEPTHWWDGQEIGQEKSIPPLYTGWTWPPHCCPYYRTAYKQYAKSFVEHGNHGRIYKPLLEACETSLSSSVIGGASASNNNIRTRSSREGGEQSERKRDRNDTILPAFYETLYHLIDTYNEKNSDDNVHDHDNDNGDNKKEPSPPPPPPFTVVLRTFGSDLPQIASVITAFAKGEHPDYPDVNFPPLCLSEDCLYQGRWKVITNTNTNHDNDNDDDNDNDNDNGNSNGNGNDDATTTPKVKVIYQLWKYHDESELVASGDSEILELLSNIKNDGSSQSIFGIRDDYNFWKANQWNPTAGKPIWVRNYDNDNSKIKNNINDNEVTEEGNSSTLYGHHLLFDDNIHNLPHDGIACVRKETSLSSPLPSSSGDDVSDRGEENIIAFETVDGADMDTYQGVHLVRVPTVEPVLNPHWYIHQIEKARNRLQLQLQLQLQRDQAGQSGPSL